jgi:hypothetical protein
VQTRGVRALVPLLLAAACTSAGEASSDPTCAGAPLCVCGPLGDLGSLTVHGGLAVDGVAAPGNALIVDGHARLWGGLATVTEVSVAGDLVTAGDARLGGSTHVGGDLAIGGDLGGDGELTVDGTLRLAGADAHTGHRTVGATAGPVATPAKSCPCSFAVEVGAGANLLPQGDTVLDHGAYAFAAPASMAGHRLIVRDDAVVRLQGPVDELGPEQLVLSPGVNLEVHVSSLVVFRPVAGVRLFVAGSEPLLVHGGGVTLYAPSAEVTYATDAALHGRAVVGALHGTGPLEFTGESCR